MVMLMALVMTVTYMPAAAFAEPIPEQNAAQTDTQTEAFAREANIDDVIISAEAEPGVFPAEAELVAEKVSKNDEIKASEAVDAVRPDAFKGMDQKCEKMRFLFL
jgi:hypothetical protein